MINSTCGKNHKITNKITIDRTDRRSPMLNAVCCMMKAEVFVDYFDHVGINVVGVCFDLSGWPRPSFIFSGNAKSFK
jgi:hypothetical protein